MTTPLDITGDVPDFLAAHELREAAIRFFAHDEWRELSGMDEEMHEIIRTMHEVGLTEMSIGLREGVQIVLYRLATP